jgi:uncharacterized protein YecT (DUF1311 family)
VQRIALTLLSLFCYSVAASAPDIKSQFCYLVAAPASDINRILSSCSKDHSHVEMTECVRSDTAKSKKALQEAEASVVNGLSQRNEEPKDIAAMKKAYEAGKDAFQSYRDKQCAFYVAMAAGGNGAHDLRLACEASLNMERAKQLKWAANNWK